MPSKNRSIKSGLARLDALNINDAEYGDVAELTEEMPDRAEIRHGEKIIRRGRPPLALPKEAIKLRIDQDILAAYRKTVATGRPASMRICGRLQRNSPDDSHAATRCAATIWSAVRPFTSAI
jgi:uncharacterized protein (DUF4415 family)